MKQVIVNEYSVKEMRKYIRNYAKKYTFAQLERMAKIQHGSISKFMRTGRGLSQKQFCRIATEYLKNEYIAHINNDAKAIPDNKPVVVEVRKPWYVKILLLIKDLFVKVLSRKKQK